MTATVEEQVEHGPGASAMRTAVRFVCRPVVAALVTVLVLWGATLALDTGGYLGTDTGGKVATLEAMAQRTWGFDPDIGYWAAEWDAPGEVHGMVYTAEHEGRYVNVTTLPMIELGAPLYRVGGYRMALLLPIAGCVLAAFAARTLARQLGADDRRAWLAYWVVALGSPLTVYALDFWEHTFGVALVAWGVVALLHSIEGGRGRPWSAVLAGAAFGAAFSMRTESLVYGFVATGLAIAWLLGRRLIGRALVLGAGVLAGVGLLVAGNLALERAVLGSSVRSGRASGTATGAGSELALRAKEAVLTAFGTQSGSSSSSLVGASLTSLLVLVLVALLVRRSSRRVIIAVSVLLGGLVLARVMAGPGFVPGMIPTTPLAAVGLVAAVGLRHRPGPSFVAAVGVLALPLVWLFQYTGGAGPQWGGRYILVSGLLLAVVGVVGLDRLPRRAGLAVIVLSFTVSWLGVGWLVIRSHEVADAASVVAGRPEPVVISTEPFWLRELAVEYPGSRWLTVATRDQLDSAAGIVESAGFDSFALVEAHPGPGHLSVPGFVADGSEDQVWLGERFRITTYERSP